MRISFLVWQRVLITLCLFLLSACSSKICREWELQSNEVACSRFSSGRIFLAGESDQCKLELEIVKSFSGTRMYINILFLKLKPNDEVQVIFEDTEEPMIICPIVFEGGQRLLIPEEVADDLIQALLAERSFTIIAGRFQTTIIPQGFIKAYEGLNKIRCVYFE